MVSILFPLIVTSFNSSHKNTAMLIILMRNKSDVLLRQIGTICRQQLIILCSRSLLGKVEKV